MNDVRHAREIFEASRVRRRTLLGALCAGACTTILRLERARVEARALPLENLGLEHLDIVVPDTAESARFYKRVFSSPLHEQEFRGGKRYFVLLGRATARPPSRLHRHRRGQWPADHRGALLRARPIGGPNGHRQGARGCGISRARRRLRHDPRS